MNLLLVKMSSLGDVIHTLPALSDAYAADARLRVDWVVEEAFQEIPAWHPAVARVIPVALRRWRRAPLTACASGEWAAFRQALRATRYDLVIDAQSLLKSAFVAALVAAPRAGLDRRSAREPLAALAYHERFAVPREMHAIERTRALFAQALGHAPRAAAADYGIRADALPLAAQRHLADSVLFLHGSSRADKCWPQAHWCALGARVAAAGLSVVLPWGDAPERARAERIARELACATVLPRLDLVGIAAVMRAVRAVVAVDTGLGHLAAALDRPCVSLYGPTREALVGTRGRQQQHIGAPGRRMDAIAPQTVWEALARGLAR